MPASNLTLTAVWLRTVSYDSAGGSPTPNNDFVAEGSTVTAASAPTRSGFTFNYWVRSDNSGAVSAGGTFTMPTQNVTLTASWTEIIPPPAKPATPTNLRTTNIGQTSIAIAWNAVSGVTGYEIFLNSVSQGTQTTLSYNFQDLTTSTTYTLGVRAYATNVSGTTYSDTASITATTLQATFTTPNVIGEPRDTAISTLETAGFESVIVNTTTTNATSVNNRRVVSQNPNPGSLAVTGSNATITVYNFLLQVPNILGLSQATANSTLANAGFPSRTSSLTTVGATVANNLKVGTQNPTGGSQYNPLDTVTFTIFNFLTAVPNVVGQQTDTAITNLGNLGFTNVTTTLDEDGATVQNVGTVKSQTPVNSSTTYNPAQTAVSIVVYSLGVTGKRSTGTGFQALTNAKRFNGTEWAPMTVYKRFDGTAWRDISN